MLNFCEIADCSKAANKCKECDYQTNCDFVWVSEIWKHNSELLTPLMPGWVKPEFTNHKIVSITKNSDFCIFNVPKNKEYITIQDICIDEKARGKGISKQLLNGLMEMYDRDIIAKCVKDSSAEQFWSHLGIKIDEEQSKKRIVCSYKVCNPNKKIIRSDLW